MSSGGRLTKPGIGRTCHSVLYGELVGGSRFVEAAGTLPGSALLHMLLRWRQLAEGHPHGQYQSDRFHVGSLLDAREILTAKQAATLR